MEFLLYLLTFEKVTHQKQEQRVFFCQYRILLCQFVLNLKRKRKKKKHKYELLAVS
jgi:hypothetical protein